MIQFELRPLGGRPAMPLLASLSVHGAVEYVFEEHECWKPQSAAQYEASLFEVHHPPRNAASGLGPDVAMSFRSILDLRLSGRFLALLADRGYRLEQLLLVPSCRVLRASGEAAEAIEALLGLDFDGLRDVYLQPGGAESLLGVGRSGAGRCHLEDQAMPLLLASLFSGQEPGQGVLEITAGRDPGDLITYAQWERFRKDAGAVRAASVEYLNRSEVLALRAMERMRGS